MKAPRLSTTEWRPGSPVLGFRRTDAESLRAVCSANAGWIPRRDLAGRGCGYSAGASSTLINPPDIDGLKSAGALARIGAVILDGTLVGLPERPPRVNPAPHLAFGKLS